MQRQVSFYSLILGLAWTATATATNASITVFLNQPGKAISPTLHGIFFEDINYGADGGLYAELIQNRSFEHREHLYAWSKRNYDAQGTLEIATDDPMNEHNPTYLRLTVEQAGQGFGVSNSGFDGIAITRGKNYRFSVRARSTTGFKGSLRVELSDIIGSIIGKAVDGIKPFFVN